jgi:hypothetical protein
MFMIMQSMKSICFAVLTLSFFVSSIYSVPPVINYAGQVAVDGEAFDGNGLFKFAIVNDSGSTTYWSNDGTSTAGSEPIASVSVSVNGGLYSVLLGNSAIQGMNAIDPSVFQQHADAKLRVWFNDGTNGFQQLTPDRSFASVPYALSAGSAGSANIAPGSINGSMLAPSLLSDLNSSISDGSVSKAKMDPNLVRYFVPEISSNPSAVSIIQGTGTTLAVQATGKFLSYQWQKNGANLAGQTNSSLVLSNANASADDANYSVVISNDWGSVTSPLARVTVATALPAITILGSTTLVHEATTSYTDAGATAVDALGGDLTSSISITSADINVTDVGDQVVTYSVSDAGGNANTATRTVTVQDTTDPVITLNQGTSYTHNLNTAWVDPGYDAQDTLDGNLTSSVSITGTVDVATTGAYTLSYTVSDTAGNQADINRTVNVAAMGPWIFTNAGATGRLGPTQAQIDANYSGTSLEGAVTINSTHQGIQEWAVPASGTYRIEAWGAQGGLALQNEVVGKGAKMSGSFALSNETVLKIIVGQMPSNLNALAGGAGGGGSYIVDLSQNPLLIAGGGGGVPNYPSTSLFDIDAIITNDGGTYVAQGRSSASGAGGSFSASNTFTNSGESFLDGGKGGLAVYEGSDGGFGGGGGSSSSNALGAGGGGYSGGSETGSGGAYQGNQGGGGSYNAGTNQDNQAGVNEGHGKVIITYIGN